MKILKLILRGLYFSFFFIAILVVLITALVRYNSYVQTVIAQKAATWASNKTGYPISIKKARLTWLHTIELDSLVVHNTNAKPMINIGQLQMDFDLAKLQDSVNLNIDHLKLIEPNIVFEIDSLTGKQNLEEFIKKINELTASKKKKDPKKRPQLFTINHAEIVDGVFEYRHNQIKKRTDLLRFDEGHFTIINLNAKVKDFLAVRDTIQLKVDLSGEDVKTGLPIHRLKTNFLINKKSMVFNDLLAHFGQTKIRNYLRFDYQKQRDMSDFFHKVTINANLDSSVFVSNDIAKFIPDTRKYNDKWFVTGQFTGKVVDFELNKARLHFGKNSRVVGNFKFEGLPNIAKTNMGLLMKNSYVSVKDLKPYLDSYTFNALQQLEFMKLDGEFVGTTKAFRTKGVFESRLGRAETDLTLKLNPIKAKSEYDGRLILNDFRIGELLGPGTELESVSMDGKVKGIGLSVKDAVLDVDGSFENIKYKGYNYQHVYLQGKLQRELFEGNASSLDSNLTFNMKGIVDLRNGKDNFIISGELKKSNLKKLKLTKDEVKLASKFDVSFSGTQIDSIFGFARFRNLNLKVNEKPLSFDTLYIYSGRNGKHRDFIIDSDLARLRFDGNYVPSVAIADIQQLAKEYKAYFANTKLDRDLYYRFKNRTSGENYHIDYSLTLLESKPLLDFFVPDTYFSNYSKLEGSFDMGSTMILNFTINSDTLRYAQNTFYNTELDINSSKFSNSAEVLASGSIYSEKQQFGTFAPTEKLSFEGAWDKDRIVFNSSLQQANSTNRADLNGNMRFNQTGIDLKFRQSSLKLLNKDWLVNSDNIVFITGSDLRFKSMSIENEGQILALDGTLSSDSTETLKVTATNFELASVAQILDVDLSGKLNGEAAINNIFASKAITGKLTVDSLVYSKIFIGDLTGTNTWDPTYNLLNLNYYIDRASERLMNIEGIYLSGNKENGLDLLARLNNTRLDMIEPFTTGIFSDFEGTAVGQIHITGQPTAPILEGEINIDNGKVKVDYLNTALYFQDKIVFENGRISTDKLRLTDVEGNKGSLNGGAIFENGLRNVSLNLDGELNNFKILNTTIKENDLFYGTAYATGKVSITGPLNNIFIKANARNNRGTKIYIPLDGTTKVSTVDYIEYITTASNKIEEEAKGKKTKKKSSTGISMDFNFNITPDAYCELQLDRQSGDVIKAYGSSDMNLKVNTLGDFYMTGIYELDRGDYSFNFQSFVTKNFKILPKSRIIWSGDPMEADLDIKAEYVQFTSLQPIFPAGGAVNNTNTDLTRKYPVSVILKLKDRMLSPSVSYEIDFKDYPKTTDFNSNVLAFKNRMLNNEQELGVQVGSLLLTQRLVEQQTDAFKLQNFTSNIAEFFSNQLGKWASNNNFQLGINAGDFSTLNQSLINSMQLQFSYNFDDRLRINHSRSGLLGNGGTDGVQGQTGSLIGDWSLEWLITKDGRLRLKGYNRNTPNVFQNSQLTNNITQYGASVLYTKSFNRFFRPKAKPKPADGDLVVKMP